ncbi:MAG TPA: DUF2520 domain-containing protein [Candidatus Limnocylindrales bacterium]|nr:DUF2520 domain-containing protein [Candidatus Limnocylindrales bacterium]
MRPFGEEPLPRQDRDEAFDELREAGIDLDPRPEVAHSHPHGQPHEAAEPGGLPAIGIVGAGPVGTALGAAFARAGWPVSAVASRDPGRRERFRSFVPGARGFVEPAALLDEAQLIVLAVPDDAIASLAGRLRLYSGQALVHTSGALGPEVLEPAMAAGTQAGTFHPLVAFADVERALEALPGSTIAIEADPELGSLLADLAEAIGAVPVRLAPGSKAAYHAGAVLAAGGVVALLDAIARLGAVAGLDETAALGVYGRLVEQTLANARALGIPAALTGPIARGDAGTLRLHLAALRAHAPEVLPLYRAAAERELAIAAGRGALDAGAAERVRRVLAEEALDDTIDASAADRPATGGPSLASEG